MRQVKGEFPDRFGNPSRFCIDPAPRGTAHLAVTLAQSLLVNLSIRHYSHYASPYGASRQDSLPALNGKEASS